MVVLAASIINKSGTALVSRQYVEMTRIRIEGLLAAFPKLVGSGKQHTYVETENVRYVYQPMETLYLILITNKQSNIVQDLETLRLLSKVVPEYCHAVEEESVCKNSFTIIFAFDEVICMGHKESVTHAQVKEYLEMDSHEERMHKMMVQTKINETKDVMKRKASEIDKNKLDKLRSDKSGIMSMPVPVSFDNGYDPPSRSNGISDTLKTSTRPSSTAAAAPAKKGMQLGKGQKTTRIIESLKAEGEDIVEDVRAAAVTTTSVPITDPIAAGIEEKITVVSKRDGGLESFELQGMLSLIVQHKEDAFLRVQVLSGSNDSFQFNTHPNIDRDLYSRENVLALKAQNRPFPVGTPTGILKWRMKSTDEGIVPITINCWPSQSGGETYVNIEYESSKNFELRNVSISIPLPALRDTPAVNSVDGEWRYDSRRSVLEWSIVLIDDSNRNGSMEFVVPAADASSFFPIDVKFSASRTFCDIKVAGITRVENGESVKFANSTQLLVDSYQVV